MVITEPRGSPVRWRARRAAQADIHVRPVSVGVELRVIEKFGHCLADRVDPVVLRRALDYGGRGEIALNVIVVEPLGDADGA